MVSFLSPYIETMTDCLGIMVNQLNLSYPCKERGILLFYPYITSLETFILILTYMYGISTCHNILPIVYGSCSSSKCFRKGMRSIALRL